MLVCKKKTNHKAGQTFFKIINYRFQLLQPSELSSVAHPTTFHSSLFINSNRLCKCFHLCLSRETIKGHCFRLLQVRGIRNDGSNSIICKNSWSGRSRWLSQSPLMLHQQQATYCVNSDKQLVRLVQVSRQRRPQHQEPQRRPLSAEGVLMGRHNLTRISSSTGVEDHQQLHSIWKPNQAENHRPCRHRERWRINAPGCRNYDIHGICCTVSNWHINDKVIILFGSAVENECQQVPSLALTFWASNTLYGCGISREREIWWNNLPYLSFSDQN